MKVHRLFLLLMATLLAAGCESELAGGHSSASGKPSGQVSGKPIKSITQTYKVTLGEGLRSMAGKVSVRYIDEDGEVSAKEEITGSTWTKKTPVAVPKTKVNLDCSASGLSVECEPGTVPPNNTYQVSYETSCTYEIAYEDGSSRIVPLWNIAPNIPDVEGRDAAETCQAVNLSCTVDKEIAATDDGTVYIRESDIWEDSAQESPVATRVVEQAGEPEAVDLGFSCNDRPLLWATRNVGARYTGDFGGLYGWGDPTGYHTEIDLHYYPSRHPADFVGKHANSISGTRCDLAYCQWGPRWRIPSKDEWAALVANCNWSKATVDGNTGMRFTSKINGNSIFLPAADMRYGNNLYRESTSPENRHGYYWAGEWEPGDAQLAYSFYFTLFSTGTPDSKAKANKQRSYGMSIRPVTQEEAEPAPVIIN